MGSNDHVPVPDPKPRVYVPLRKAPTPDYTSGSPTTSTERLDALEKNWKNHVAEVVSLKTSMVKQSRAISELLRHLRATIRGVTRLSQGKSTGNLGLPMDEDWTEFKP